MAHVFFIPHFKTLLAEVKFGSAYLSDSGWRFFSRLSVIGASFPFSSLRSTLLPRDFASAPLLCFLSLLLLERTHPAQVIAALLPTNAHCPVLRQAPPQKGGGGKRRRGGGVKAGAKKSVVTDGMRGSCTRPSKIQDVKRIS